MKKRIDILIAVISVIIFVAALGGFIDSILSRNGAQFFICATALWFFGTVLKTAWEKYGPAMKRLPNEDIEITD